MNMYGIRGFRGFRLGTCPETSPTSPTSALLLYVCSMLCVACTKKVCIGIVHSHLGHALADGDH